MQIAPAPALAILFVNLNRAASPDGNNVSLEHRARVLLRPHVVDEPRCGFQHFARRSQAMAIRLFHASTPDRFTDSRAPASDALSLRLWHAAFLMENMSMLTSSHAVSRT